MIIKQISQSCNHLFEALKGQQWGQNESCGAALTAVRSLYGKSVCLGVNRGFGSVLPSMVLWLMLWLSANSPATQSVFVLYYFVCTLQCQLCVRLYEPLPPFAALALCKYPMADQVTDSPANGTASDCPHNRDGDNCTGRSRAGGFPCLRCCKWWFNEADCKGDGKHWNKPEHTEKERGRSRLPMTQFVQIKWVWLCDILLTGLFCFVFYFP